MYSPSCGIDESIVINDSLLTLESYDLFTKSCIVLLSNLNDNIISSPIELSFMTAVELWPGISVTFKGRNPCRLGKFRFGFTYQASDNIVTKVFYDCIQARKGTPSSEST